MKKSRFSTNIWSITAGRAGPSCVINISAMQYRWVSSVSRYKRRRSTHQWILFMTDDAEKNTQKGNIFCVIMDSPGGGATAPWVTFSESSRRVDVKSYLTSNAAAYLFEILPVKWQKMVSKRPKMVHRSPFWPNLEPPKYITVQNFAPIGRTVAEIICPG